MIVAGCAALGVAALVTPATAQDANFGKQIWLNQANCADCHGWLGDGNNADPRSPRGANLRETSMDAETIAMVVLCGIPGTGMPHFDARAYTDDRCYGSTRAQMGDSTPPTGAMELTARHARGLAAFILQEFAGKPVTPESCEALLGADAQRCHANGVAPAAAAAH